MNTDGAVLLNKHSSLLDEAQRGWVERGGVLPDLDDVLMGRQYFMDPIYWVVSDGSAIANTTAETIIFTNQTVPANYLQGGRQLRITAYGRHSTTATPTLTFRLRWGGVGGTVLAASGAMTCGSAVSAAMWMVELLVQTRLDGPTGTLFVTGFARLGEDAASTVGSATNAGAQDFMGSAGVATPAAVTVDLTPDTALSLTATWSAASASNTLTGHSYTGYSPN